ncbi:monooxygenase, partial [Streptomyces sp. NPDC059744]
MLALVVGGEAGPALLDSYEVEREPVASWSLDITSERLRATLEAIKEPGGGLDAAATPETTGLSRGYRWSSLSRNGTGGNSNGPLRAGDRAPDAPCRKTATGAPIRLFDAIAGAHFTLLGFGAGTAEALREAAAKYGDALRAYTLDPANSDGLTDDEGHAHSAYGIVPGEDTLVLVRPDNHVGLIAPATDGRAVVDYLDRPA